MVSRDDPVHRRRTNALLGWAATGIVALGAAESLLANDLLWSGFELLMVAVIAFPALATGDWTALVPWPLPACAAFAGVVQAFELHPEAAGYVAVVTVALVVVVEMDVFTSVELSRRFAVAVAVMTTMAVQSWWTIAQFYSDAWLGTGFLSSQTELQWDLVVVTVVGFVMGGLFQLYFDRFGPEDARERQFGHSESP